MKFTSLGSGSSGNAFLLDTGTQRVLFDCGVSARAIHAALAGSHLPLTVLISHEHIDHVRSLESVVKRHVCKVVATSGTFDSIGRRDGWKTVRAGDRLAFDDLSISFVDVSHDAAEPCGFFIEGAGLKVSLLTDLGCTTPETLDIIAESNVVVLESNYDETMLRHGPYPSYLKKRIRSSFGHLSNDDCAATVAEAAGNDTNAIYLCHLSHNNNTAEAAVAASINALIASGRNIPVTALPRYEAMPIVPHARKAMQSALF